MNIILDAIIVAVLVFSVIIITKKGFLKSLIGVVGIIVAIILSLTMAPPLAEATYSLFIDEAVSDTVSGAVVNLSDKSEAAVSDAVNSIYSSLPSFVCEYAEKAGYSAEKIASSVSSDTIDTENLTTALCDNAIKPAVISILKYVFVLVLFVPFVFLSRFLAKFIKALIKGNIFGRLDTALGLVLGLGTGVVFVIIFCLIVSLISNLSASETLSQAIEASFIFKTVLNFIPFSI